MLTTEHFVSAQKAQFATLFGLGAQALESVEQLAALNLKTAKEALQSNVEQAQAVLAVQAPQDLVALQGAQTQPLAEKTAAYGRSVYDIATGLSNAWRATAEAQTADWRGQWDAAVSSVTQNAPQGSELAMNAVKTALHNATAAFESVQKSVKQATDMAESNINAMTATAASSTARKTPARAR